MFRELIEQDDFYEQHNLESSEDKIYISKLEFALVGYLYCSGATHKKARFLHDIVEGPRIDDDVKVLIKSNSS